MSYVIAVRYIKLVSDSDLRPSTLKIKKLEWRSHKKLEEIPGNHVRQPTLGHKQTSPCGQRFKSFCTVPAQQNLSHLLLYSYF